MKILVKLLSAVTIVALLSSCSTAKLTIYGITGTKIMNIRGDTLSTIADGGKTTIRVNKDYGYVLLSQAPNDSTVVPFIPNLRETPEYVPWGMLATICIPLVGLTSLAICDEEWIQPETRTNNDIVNEATIKAYRESQR